MISSPSKVFCDYLTVTNRPDNSCVQDIRNYLLSHGAFVDSDYSGRVSVYLDPLKNKSSRVQLKETSTYVSIAATGSALTYLREHGLFSDYLNILASVPHNVTRLDAAVDYMEDAVPKLKQLGKFYSNREARITRKAVPVSKFLSRRLDGEETGTIYFGKRGKSSIIARVYDKQWEQFDRFGLTVPAQVRFELECGRSFSTSLKDASDPHLLFWNHAHVFRLAKPDGLKPWTPAGDYSRYEKVVKPDLLPYELLARRVDKSMEVQTLYEMAQGLGENGTQTLLRILKKKFDDLGTELGNGS